MTHGFRLTVALRYLDHCGRLRAALRDVLLEHMPPDEWFRYPPLRWSRVFRDESRESLTPLLQRLGSRKAIPEPIDELVGRLDVRARDPNITRERFREGWFG